ncbi:MAG: hypothetical protein MNSN_02850 [Minisyncoccus archaeiphilus]|uniref:hypothetical protein n=1 Tax=Minisyncoccus archaeiphilus TaxID=3238481 RepID=UPI002B15D320|nr:MAG: hypothetical protein MNSN_02850 [Candidatus Parcubacteria bacterium]
MEEYKIIKTLESFKKTEPNQNWAGFSKKEIISKSFNRKSFSFSEMYVLFRSSIGDSSRLAIGASCSVILTAFLIAGIAFNDHGSSVDPIATKPLSPEERLLAAIKSTDIDLSRIPLSDNGEEKVAAQDIKVEARKALANASEQLKSLPDTQKVAFADNVVSKVKALEKNTNAVIMDEYEGKTAIQEFYQEFYKVIAENKIKEIENIFDSLTEEQKGFLDKAKSLFEKEEYDKSSEELDKIKPSLPEEEKGS